MGTLIYKMELERDGEEISVTENLNVKTPIKDLEHPYEIIKIKKKEDGRET